MARLQLDCSRVFLCTPPFSWPDTTTMRMQITLSTCLTSANGISALICISTSLTWLTSWQWWTKELDNFKRLHYAQSSSIALHLRIVIIVLNDLAGLGTGIRPNMSGAPSSAPPFLTTGDEGKSMTAAIFFINIKDNSESNALFETLIRPPHDSNISFSRLGHTYFRCPSSNLFISARI